MTSCASNTHKNQNQTRNVIIKEGSNMARSYKGVPLKKNRVYNVEDIQRLFDVSANTISNWVGEGLQPSDLLRPYVFQGASLQHFHLQRRERSRKNLRAGEFHCTGCKAAVFPDVETVRDLDAKSGKHMYIAVCPDCENPLYKLSNAADRDIVLDCRNPNSSRQRLHEEKDQIPGGIGIEAAVLVPKLYLANDRTIYKWLTYSGRFDDKTVDGHLSAIRYCDEICGGKLFEHYTVEDAARVRDDLKRRVRKDEDDNLSTSTVKHRASHLVSFFEWCLKQDSFSRLPKDLSAYFQLPKAAFAAAPMRVLRAFPTIDEAQTLLLAMPSASLYDRRARAIFAIAFLGALRADTVISLRLKHVDVAGQRVIQDGTTLRSKNGKSANISWFPIPPVFAEEVVRWYETLHALNYRDEDALFPSAENLFSHGLSVVPNRKPIPVMLTKHAASEAFAIACRNGANNYSPHSAKHTIGSLRDEKHLTHAQRRAWSENMGHESERITETHYAKFSEVQRAEVLASIAHGSAPIVKSLSDEQKDAFLEDLFELLSRRGRLNALG
ncbi:tyrosine-type recombinase/integrase [Pseudorhodobacter sp. W20_MBD10_FR17]|uniref:tyrosine-type recombinase/integrase n=1 Tax=Pseudorhodobacter sp. W20_MBD10_FR17 TaxID=3240266 RepID=UPI003F9835C6